MFNSFIIGAISATSLLLARGEEIDNTPVMTEPSTLLRSQTIEQEHIKHLDIAERLLYMMPARPESEDSQAIRESVLNALEEREMERATEQAERLTEEERQKAIDAWENAFPVIDSQSAQAQFINEIARESVEIARRNDLYPSVMIAQAGLESNWGRSGLARGYNNLMGTKGSWNGQTVNMRTREDIGGQSIYINAGFSVYESWGESLERYGQLLRNGIRGNAHFYAGAWRSNAESYQDATDWLEGRYATDTQYARKLNNTIEQFDLTRFDDVTPLDDDLQAIEVLPEPQAITMDAPEGYYEVQEGDSLFGLSLSLEASIFDLLEWNDLQTPLLDKGQWLAVEEVDQLLTVEDLLIMDEEYVEYANNN